MASPTKYDLLAHIVDNSNDQKLDQAGNYHVVSGIVDIISRTYGSEEELSDAIYDYIAECYVHTDDDETTPTDNDS